MWSSSGANPGTAAHLPLRGFSRLPRVAGYNIASPGRVSAKFPEALLVDEASPLELFDRQDRAPLADRLSRVARSGLYAFNAPNVFIGVYPACVFLFDLPLRTALGAPGPAATVSCVSWKALPSCTGRSAVQNISGLERNGANLRGRARSAARSRNAHKLVQHSAVAVSRSFVGSSICRVEPGLLWLLLEARIGSSPITTTWLDIPDRQVLLGSCVDVAQKKLLLTKLPSTVGSFRAPDARNHLAHASLITYLQHFIDGFSLTHTPRPRSVLLQSPQQPWAMTYPSRSP
jgi:hypothetical protein